MEGTPKLNLPEVSRVLFEDAPLVLTLAQIRYPASVRFGEQSSLAGLQDDLAKDYPNANPEQQISVAIDLSGVQQQQQQSSSLWRFSTLDRNWAVVVGQDSVTIEAYTYEQIDDFCARVQKVLQVIEKWLRPTHQVRLGLRYINEIRHENGKNMGTWKDLLNQELLGLSAQLGENVDHSYHEIRSRVGSEVLLVHHGLLRGSAVNGVNLQSSNDPFYLLDLDYFDETPAVWDTDQMIRRIAEWNEIMYRLFRWSMNEALFNYLGPREA